MTRLNKVRKLEERIAPSFIGFSGSAQADASGHASAYGTSADANASANVGASGSVGWVHPLLLIRALQQNGLTVDSSIDLSGNGNIAY